MKLSVSPMLSSAVLKSLRDLLLSVFPALHFVKICLPESKWYPQSKVKVTVLNLSDKMTT
jgi:hypothetical protein